MIFIIPLFIVVCIVAWMLRPRKNISKSRKYAILSVILPSLVLVVTAVVFQLLQNATGNVEVSDISNTLFIAGTFVIGAAILALTGFAVARKGEIAKGIGFGICIAVLVSIIELGLLEGLAGV
jgi:peptidoglycan/LPS O-acetylase OafA/YrhL